MHVFQVGCGGGSSEGRVQPGSGPAHHHGNPRLRHPPHLLPHA